jgi:hypothetical protein
MSDINRLNHSVSHNPPPFNAYFQRISSVGDKKLFNKDYIIETSNLIVDEEIYPQNLDDNQQCYDTNSRFIVNDKLSVNQEESEEEDDYETKQNTA